MTRRVEDRRLPVNVEKTSALYAEEVEGGCYRYGGGEQLDELTYRTLIRSSAKGSALA